VVIRGGKNPLLVLLTSSCAEAWGAVVPMPVWAKMLIGSKKTKITIIRCFMILCFYFFCQEFEKSTKPLAKNEGFI
jgi:hypothetical protein